ncbi:MAG: TMEM175 family protein, partial [Bacteroidota bacterium]
REIIVASTTASDAFGSVRRLSAETMRDRIIHRESLKHFTLRGEATQRLDAMSDGVFALAIAMLLLSSSVPQHFQELLDFVYDAVPFFVCMLFVFWIWQEQATFFLRYGIYDGKATRLNFVLLFFVLFYVFPLKFLMSWMLKYFALVLGWLTIDKSYATEIRALGEVISWDNVPILMLIYGIGFVSIFGVLWLMYRYALQKKGILKLTDIETLETQLKIAQQGICVFAGSLSCSLAIIGIVFNLYWVGAFLAGVVYNLVWILMIPRVRQYQRKLEILLKK